VRMEAALPDTPVEEGTTEEALDGDFALGEYVSIAGEDGELEGISVDDEEMKDPEADDGDDDRADLPESRMYLGDPGYLPDEIFAQAAAAITARVENPTGARGKAVEREQRNRKWVRSMDFE